LRRRGDDPVAVVLEPEVLDADGRADHGPSGGQCLQHLDPGAPAEPDRHDHEASGGQLGRQVLHESDDLDAGGTSGGSVHRVQRPGTDQAQPGIRTCGDHSRPALLHEADDPHQVRLPVERAEEEHTGIARERRRHAEQLVVDSVWHEDRVGAERREMLPVSLGYAEQRVGTAGRTALDRRHAVTAKPGPQRAEAERRAAARQCTPDARIDVLERHGSARAGRHAREVLRSLDLLEVHEGGGSRKRP
jgi:hypothetical protein